MFKNFFAITIVLLLLSPVAVSAHILLTSGSIGVTMHIDPDDDPIANQTATFYLEFKDLNNKLTLNGCRCQVTISQNGEEIFFDNVSPVNANSPLSGVFQVKFPVTGVYDMQIKGDPVQAGAFDSFTIDQAIDVERGSAGDTAATKPDFFTSHIPHFAAIFVVLGFLIAGIIARIRENKAKRKPASADAG